MGKMRQFRRELRSCVGRPLSYQVSDGWGASLVPTLERIIRVQGAHDGEIFAAFDDGDVDGDARLEIAARRSIPNIVPGGRGGKATAVISVHGIAMYDLEFQPYAYSNLLLSQTVNQLAADPEIGTIVLDMNSPGGMVTGTKEAADAIFAARSSTKVVAIVNPLAASAAYHLASQASEIVAVPSADVGSIGVFMMHADCSGLIEQSGIKPTYIFAGPHKVDGNPYEALSEDARDHYQGEVDKIYAEFVKTVARGRGVSAAKVLADFGGGRTLMAKDALAAGMIDRIATLDKAYGKLGLIGNTLNMEAKAHAPEFNEAAGSDAPLEIGAGQEDDVEENINQPLNDALENNTMADEDVSELSVAEASADRKASHRRRLQILRF